MLIIILFLYSIQRSNLLEEKYKVINYTIFCLLLSASFPLLIAETHFIYEYIRD